ncbi:putative methyltransferase-domain-containing protein [Absidia repens]|uniref:Putative methyltransferase-domain-containing protein n=1 Tax=Absidia repens TaxID=90262 RepID=A0A1X2IGJ4_9FUNG|nr:putative methyltransferase-domain-containing protein [Absidia repens]
MSSDEEDGFAGGLFGEEEEPIAQVPNTVETYERESASFENNDQPKAFHIRLVGSHPLWAHHLWNASKVFASLFDQHPQLVQGKTLLELGAGGALPSLVAATHQPAKVVVTDYPDAELIENIQYNVDQNLGSVVPAGVVTVQGFIWGTNTTKLKAELPEGRTTYDVIILSDLVFNHSQHHALLKTCRELLTPKTGRVYVFYTHHRPHLAHRDLEFFKIAERPSLGYGFKTDQFITKKMHVMFEEDPGDEQVRATVHGWQMWLP